MNFYAVKPLLNARLGVFVRNFQTRVKTYICCGFIFHLGEFLFYFNYFRFSGYNYILTPQEKIILDHGLGTLVE